MSKERLKARIENLEVKLNENEFYKEKGLGNEVPFYVFDYNPSYEMFLRDQIKFLVKKFNEQNSEKKIEIINIYELIIKILDEKNYIDKSIEREKKRGKKALLKAVKNSLRLTSKKSMIKKEIQKVQGKNKVIFLTGIGTAWPFIRASKLLNNLHSIITKNPLILFYPGSYDQHNLRLFNKLKSKHYYRAFILSPNKKRDIKR